MASRRWRPFGVQKPPPGANDSNGGVEKTPGLTNDVGESFVTSVGEVQENLKGIVSFSATFCSESASPDDVLIPKHSVAILWISLLWPETCCLKRVT
jgi:hypothetical protein